MKKSIIILLFASLCVFNADAQKKIPHNYRPVGVQPSKRTEIILPQVNGYNVYKGDFHIHTSYSDGRVNPAGRVLEAWYDGLDVIAITDHYEGCGGVKKALKVAAPHFPDGKPVAYKTASESGVVPADFNAIYKEAEWQVKFSRYPLLLIKGCEMAREPKEYGHFNCLFLKDANTVYNKDIAEAFKNVHKQGGIVIHNHPSYRRPGGTTDKSESHKKLYDAGLIDGVEIVNGTNFYPRMVRRCIEEKLTMLANTDEHVLTSYRFGSHNCHRTMTLILAKDLTEKAIKDAFLKRRTLAYFAGNLAGEEQLLVDFLNAAVECRIVKEDKKKGERTYMLTNMSSITYQLRRGKTIYELEPFKSVMVPVGKNKNTGESAQPTFHVENMWHIDFQHPTITLELDK
ncbi:MAG: histidinol-phosphatase [Alistipes sp.]|nr:histidinol-phosphatase [Alistipes sp.]